MDFCLRIEERLLRFNRFPHVNGQQREEVLMTMGVRKDEKCNKLGREICFI